MGIESSRKSTIPDYTMPITQVPPRELAPFGFNILASINDTILGYTQGIFASTPSLAHDFSHNENSNRNSRIHITDAGGEDQLNESAYPRIVINTDDLMPMGVTGINSRSGLDFKTGEERKVELFQANVLIQIYGKYTEVQQYGSLLLMTLTFLTRPLKLYTIYKVGKPRLSGLRKYRTDAKGTTWVANIRFNVLKEGSAVITNTNIVTLKKIAFKCRQVFVSGTSRAIVRLS